MSKFARSTIAAGTVALAMAVAGVRSSQAAIVYMDLSDIHTPPAIAGVAGFDGTTQNIVGIGGTDDFVLNYGGLSPFIASDSYFAITSGFHVNTTLIADSDNSGTITTGDSVTASIGAGGFEIRSGSDVLVSGTFNNAVLNTTVGSSTVNINSANVNGLNLTPGSVLTANLGFADFDPNESFAIGLVGIDPGVQIASAIPLTSHLWRGSMASFGLSQDNPTSGSVDLVANLVPEPASLGLLGLGALGLLGRRRRRLLKKLGPTSLAVAAGLALMAGGATQSQAAVLYMNFSDIHSPIGGVAGYDATSGGVVSLGGQDTFTLSGAVSHAFLNDASFEILSGFQVTDTIVSDDNLNGMVDTGDTVSSVLGSGTFRMKNPAGNLVFGSFDSATLSTSIGSTAVTINSSNASGLDLTPEAGLTGLGIIDLNPVESFSLNIVGINPGVSVSNIAHIDPDHPEIPFYTASLNTFAVGQTPVTSGSVDLVANAVVPEPASLGLLSVGALGLIARRRRRA